MMTRASTSGQNSSYARRNKSGISAPIDIDSDSDFNPGEYVAEETKPSRRRLSASKKLAKHGPQKRSTGGDKATSVGSRKRVKRSRGASEDAGTDGRLRRQQIIDSLCIRNPLAQFFESMDLHSESEDSVLEPSYEESDVYSQSEEEEELTNSDYSGTPPRHSLPSKRKSTRGKPAVPSVLRTLEVTKNKPAPVTSSEGKANSRGETRALHATMPKGPWTPNAPWVDTDAEEADDEGVAESITESESEPETSLIPPLIASAPLIEDRPKRKIAPTSQGSSIKKSRLPPNDNDESVTEPESDIDPEILAKTLSTIKAKGESGGGSSGATKLPLPYSFRREVNKFKQGEQSVDEDSFTESESDSSSPLQPFQKQRGSQGGSDKEDLSPRPNLPLPSHGALEPLVLNEKSKIQVPARINTYLREYQREGVQFLFKCYAEGRGGWLGDDMGLGKTIQVIAFLSAIMRKHGDTRDIGRRHDWVSKLQDGELWKKKRILKEKANEKWDTALIIAPSSVLGNWKREIDKWGYFDVGLYTGKNKDQVVKDFSVGRLDILLASFDGTLRSIADFCSLPLSVIIVDEAHRLKNPNSKLTNALHSFHCARRFGLSGTVIQNDLTEMWACLDWCCPGRVGERKTWAGYIAKPIKEGQSKDSSDSVRKKAYEVTQILVKKILPLYWLRRTKDNTIKDQLPKKYDQVVFCPLTPRQARGYETILQSRPVQNMVRKDEICDCGSRKLRAKCCYPYSKADIFIYIDVLIKISNHLGLVLPSDKDTEEQRQRNRELSALLFRNSQVMPTFGPMMLQDDVCGKWSTLETLLRAWKEEGDNKVLVFTKSLKLLDMLQFHLDKCNYGFLMLHGGTKQEERMPLVDRFQDDPNVFVFLISTLAGGTGLNLTSANKVVIFDPNWNPAHDLQAMDRAYRFGQIRDVYVYRLLGAGSVEELIYERQVYKQQQMKIAYEGSVQTRYFRGVQGDTSKQGELFGLKNIFRSRDAGKCDTESLIEQANFSEFSWTLATMDPSTSGSSSAEYIDAEDNVSKRSENDLRGLGALLFDDAVPSEDMISKAKENSDDAILEKVGISYRHDNEKLLQGSRVEEEKLRMTSKRKRKSGTGTERKVKRRRQGEEEQDKPTWPPVRGLNSTRLQVVSTQPAKKLPPPPPPYHPKKQTEDSSKMLYHRELALVGLGLIPRLEDYSRFVDKFRGMTAEGQMDILRRLDEFEPDDSD